MMVDVHPLFATFLAALCMLAGCRGDAPGSEAVGESGGSGTGENATDAYSSTEGTFNGGSASLVLVDGWTADPTPPPALMGDRPAVVDCEFGWGLEDGVFEVDSGLCNWGAFVQPSLEPIVAGDQIEIIVLHDALYSEDDGATAHIAVSIGEAVVWDTTVMIPAPQGLLRPAVLAPADAPVGTPIHVHVHNHGYNNYRFVDMIVNHR
ncbi:MAG: hypothetical protein JKY37_22370 [Nannocystaceae bacterium]|nr:hypothetical protein [Nannocystaceae bacterium]